MSSVLNELHHRFGELPKALGRVAQYILTNPEKVSQQTIADLSVHSGSGQASILRLVQSLGFDGFSAFKTALSIELAQRPSYHSGNGTTDLQNLVGALAAQTGADAEATATLLGESEIETVAQRVLAAKQVWVFGSGISGFIADLLNYRLTRLGIATTAFHDPILLRELTANIDSKTVAISISDSGSTPYSVAFLREAIQREAFTVAISSRKASELVDHADVLLQTGATGDFDNASNVLGVTTRVTLVIEVLGRCIERLTHSKA